MISVFQKESEEVTLDVIVYYRGLGWYAGRVKEDTLVYNPGKRENPKYPNIYLLMRESSKIIVSEALNIEQELVSVY